jgi:hypothetical protein
MQRHLTLAIFIGMITLFSCTREQSETEPETPEVTELTETTTTDVQMDGMAEEVFENAAGIDAVTAGESIGIYGDWGIGLFPNLDNPMTNSRCYNVTVTPRDRGVFPKKVVVEFGNDCRINGRLRKGRLVTIYSGPLHIPGNKAVTELDGYFLDSSKITGRFQIQNTTEPGSNQRRFTKTVNAKVYNLNRNIWWMWNGTTITTQIEGNGTPLFPRDDVFRTTFSRRGESSNGRSWAAETKEPLIKAFTCPWISKGSVYIRTNGREAILDYGRGQCDKEATLTINGVSKVIKLR